jgi:glycosyltransferase involved in cell wall biosynthesis
LDVELVIIGEGSLKAELKALAEKEKVKVEFRGNVPQALLPEELNKSEIFVLPSLYEGNPKVLIEAMACGLVCVGTNVSGIRELITNDLNGILVHTNPQSLKAGILELLENVDKRAKLGKQAREKILSQNSFPVFIERELSVYQSVI